MLRFGNIAEVNHATGLVRVELPEDAIVTSWLSYVWPATRASRSYSPPVVGESVAVLLDEYATDGVVLGAIYAAEVDTPGADPGQHFTTFADGGRVEYDENTGRLTVNKGSVNVLVDGAKITISKGGESLGGILSDLIDQLAIETHTAPSGPTTPPLNAAAYTAIKTRLTQFLG
jgi:phage baseplate assembly protein V